MYKNVCFLNTNDGNSILAFGGKNILKTNGEGLFNSIDNFNHTHKSKYIFSCLSYDLKNQIEDLSSKNIDLTEFPELVLFCPQHVVKLTSNGLEWLQGQKSETSNSFVQDFILNLSNEDHSKQQIQFNSRIAKETYLSKVNTLKKHIQRGDIYEINFCQEYYAQEVEKEHLKNAYAKLNNITKAPFSSYFMIEGFEVFCGSPERFIKREGTMLVAQPIKGTAKRGKTKKEDEQIKTALNKDPKERAENIMIVDLMRNDLSKIAAKGTVRVNELCKVYSFNTVHQMISTVSCEVKENLPFTEVLKATFPMGSMTGAPKYKAMELIENFEDFKRGLYSGSIGYFSPNGDFDFNVVIRTLIYNETAKTLSCSVGSAITINSDAEKEYEECGIKIQKILDGIGM